MICDSLQGIALPRLKYFHLFFNRISCCLGEVSLATAAWVAVGEIFLWNNPADREALGLSREGAEPLNKVAVATSYPISHPMHSIFVKSYKQSETLWDRILPSSKHFNIYARQQPQ